MISVGIDVAKGKSTVCILKPYGEIVSKPFDISHIEKDLGELAAIADYSRKLFPCHSFGFTGFLDSLSYRSKIEVKMIVPFIH